MAQIAGNFVFVLDFETVKGQIQDANPYLAEGVPNGSTVSVYVEKIVSPNGTVIHENPIEDATPDATYTYSGLANHTFEFDIPTYEDGSYQTGNYVIDYATTADGDTYTKSKSFAFLAYVKPTPKLTVTADTVKPLLTATDETDYDLANYNVEISPTQTARTITIDFPADGVPDLVGNDASLETAVFYTTTQTITLERALLWNLTGDDDFYIRDQLTYVHEENIVCVQELASISALVDRLYTKYDAARKVNPTTASNAYKKWVSAGVLYVQIKDALTHGFKDSLNEYKEQIKELSEEYDCPPDPEEIVQISGMSIIDNNTVTLAYAELIDGTGFNFAPQAESRFFALFSHNKSYTPVQADYDGLWIEFQDSSLQLGETSNTAHRGDHGVIAYNHSQATGNPHGTTIANISGLQDALDARLTRTKLELAISFSDTEVWNTQTKTLDLSTADNYDLVRIVSDAPVFTVVGAQQSNPCYITIDPQELQYLKSGDQIDIGSVGGMTELNGNSYYINIEDYATGVISLVGIDATSYGAYSGGGVFGFTSGVFAPEILKISGITSNSQIEILTEINVSPIYKHTNKGSAAEDDIIINSASDLQAVGRSDAPDSVLVRRRGNYNLVKPGFIFS